MPTLGHQFTQLNVVVPSNCINDLLNSWLRRTGSGIGRTTISQGLLSQFKRDWNTVRHRKATKARQCTLKLTNVGIKASRNISRNIIRQLYAMKRSLRLQNLDARLVWRPINSRHQATVESTYQALLKVGNFRRRSIRTQHNLPTTLVQGIKCVEELFLCLFVLG